MPIVKLSLPLLSALAVFAAMSIVYLGSASGTALCAEEEAPCDPLEAYPSGTAIKGNATNTHFHSSSMDVSCADSRIRGESTAEEGTPLPGKVTEFTLSECGCSASPVHIPYAANTEWVSGGNGEAKLESGGSGAPGVTLTCTGIKCTYTGNPAMTLTGGTPATLALAEAKLERESGGFLCPTTATWTATYTITSVSPLYVSTQAKAAPAALCKSAPESIGGDLKCKKGDAFAGNITGSLWIAPTELEAMNAKWVAYAAISCEKSDLVGNFESNGTSALKEGVIYFALFTPDNNAEPGPCVSTLNGNPEVTVTWKNFNWDKSHFSYLRATEPEGKLFFAKEGGTPGLEIAFGKETCSYTRVGKVIWGEVYNPVKVGMRVRVVSDWKTANGGECPPGIHAEPFLELKPAVEGDVYLAKEQQ